MGFIGLNIRVGLLKRGVYLREGSAGGKGAANKADVLDRCL